MHGARMDLLLIRELRNRERVVMNRFKLFCYSARNLGIDRRVFETKNSLSLKSNYFKQHFLVDKPQELTKKGADKKSIMKDCN